MKSKEKIEIESFLKSEFTYNEVLTITCIPFRQKQLKGDLAYSFLKNPNKAKEARVIRLSCVTDKLLETLNEIASYVGKFSIFLWLDSGEVYQYDWQLKEPSLIHKLSSLKNPLIGLPKKQQANFFSATRAFLLKALIFHQQKTYKKFSLLQFSKDYGVPQSTVQNFKKTGIEAGHLKVNRVGNLVLIDLIKTLEEWSFKQENDSIYYVQHLFDEKPEKIIETLLHKKHKMKVALGAYLSLKVNQLYPVNTGIPSIYIEKDLDDFVEDNQLVLCESKSKNSIEIRIPKPSYRVFDLCKPYEGILKLDRIQSYLDLRHGLRGEEIKDFLIDRVFSK